MWPLRPGVDVTDAAEWSARLARCPDLARIAFTPLELRQSGGAPERLAKTWAVKEAVVKALGTGFAGVGWRGVEVAAGAHGRPRSVRVTCTHLVEFPSSSLRLALRTPSRPAGRARSWPVVAAVAWGDRTAAVTAARLDPAPGMASRPRAGRAARASAAARRTAEAAAEVLMPGRDWQWERTPQGAPVLRACRGPVMAVALSHGVGVTVAVVAAPVPRAGRPLPQPAGKPSSMLTIIEDDDLLEGVSVSD